MRRSIIISAAVSMILFSGCGGSNSFDKKYMTLSSNFSKNLSALSLKQIEARYDGVFAEGNTSSYMVVANPKNGTVTLYDNGYYTYIPTAGFQGEDSFSYKKNINSSCNPTVVTIDVNSQNSTLPIAPNMLNATMPCPNKLILSWQDNADNEDGFVIYQDGKPIAMVNCTHVNIDFKPKEGEVYTFEVRARNMAGVSSGDFIRLKVVEGKLVQIKNIIKNGSFEQNLTDWSYQGTIETVASLGSVSPKGKQMLLMNSRPKDGLKSSISQAISVPTDATELKISYNLVSEEPMEYVDQEYDDTFELHINSREDNSSQIINSVNMATWYPVDGINFKGGDDTAFQTNWLEKSVDISKYRGENIVIELMIFNKGNDEEFDTVALIETIELL